MPQNQLTEDTSKKNRFLSPSQMYSIKVSRSKGQKNYIYKIAARLDNWPNITALLMLKCSTNISFIVSITHYTNLSWHLFQLMFYNYIKFKCNFLVFWFQAKSGWKFLPHGPLAMGKAVWQLVLCTFSLVVYSVHYIKISFNLAKCKPWINITLNDFLAIQKESCSNKVIQEYFQDAYSFAVRSAWCNPNNDWGEMRRLREERVIWLGFATFLVIWCCTYNLYGSLLPLYKNKKCVMFKWDNTCESKHFKILTKVWSLSITFLKPKDCPGFSPFFSLISEQIIPVFIWKLSFLLTQAPGVLESRTLVFWKTLTNIPSCSWRNWETNVTTTSAMLWFS